MEQGEYNIYCMVSDFHKHKCKFVTVKKPICIVLININMKTYSPEECKNDAYS